MERKFSRRLLSLLLALFLVLPALPLSALTAVAQPGPFGQPVFDNGDLRIAFMSDVHLFPEELTGNYNQAFIDDNVNRGKPAMQGGGLLRSALAALKKHNDDSGLDYLIVTGDLTRDGEYLGHQKMAQYLKDLEDETGIKVVVTNGNHDIENHGAADYTSGKQEDARITHPEDFLEIYADLGYDLPNCHRFVPQAGNKGGMLSYAADLNDQYRLIVIDTGEYSPDNADGKDWAQIGGRIGPDLMAWVKAEAAAAQAAGKTIVSVGHHNLTEHLGYEGSIWKDYVLKDFQRTREELADAGIHFYFSGHIHLGEMSDIVSDAGERFYDICVPALTCFPSEFREVVFHTDPGGKITADVTSHRADEILSVTAAGHTYQNPYYPENFQVTFGDYETGTLRGFVKANVRKSLSGMLGDVANAGGIQGKLKDSGVDIQQSLHDALKGGLVLGNWNIFSEKNLTGLIDDIFAQLDEVYINDPDHTFAILDQLFDELFSLPVSKVPCTYFLDTLQFGDPNKPGTLEDFGNSALAYMFWKDCDLSQDPFMQDVVRRIESGELLDQLLDFVINKVSTLIAGELLPNLKLNPKSVFVNQLSKDTVGSLLSFLLEVVTGGGRTRDCLQGFLKTLGIQPGLGLRLTMKPIVGLVVDQSKRQVISHTLLTFVNAQLINPQPYGDRNAQLIYDGPTAPEATAENYRLPMNLTVTVGDDKTSATVTWDTKWSVTGSDVRLFDAQGNIVTAAMTDSTEAEELLVDQLDIAFTKLLGTPLPAQRHTVVITGLTPDTVYQFEAGDSARGWWSGRDTFRTGPEPCAWWKTLVSWLQIAWEWLLDLLGIS
ncbi:MAG: metallophosphoesterase [Oscillospiraceae bacterium]|nr:metallophosphoesterase [Oscillospiraceae bacterium]